ncbi:MAG: DUF429 domain-containing protein [Campylobacterota bacterium]|nr:DUF429 domain-containing protein [Campylobacterota bacterium]
MQNIKKFVGIDLAWKRTNPSFVVVLDQDACITYQKELAFDNILPFLQTQIEPNEAIIGVDAPLIVNNETGNRSTEIEFLKSYSKYRLGAYPVNRQLLMRSYGGIIGEELCCLLRNYKMVEVYPHATILNLFNDRKVLPYKYKKGRNKAFYIEQLGIYSDYLDQVITGLDRELFDTSTIKSIKVYEDYLDSITCAYTLYHQHKYPNQSEIYGSKEEGLLIVPT